MATVDDDNNINNNASMDRDSNSDKKEAYVTETLKDVEVEVAGATISAAVVAPMPPSHSTAPDNVVVATNGSSSVNNHNKDQVTTTTTATTITTATTPDNSAAPSAVPTEDGSDDGGGGNGGVDDIDDDDPEEQLFVTLEQQQEEQERLALQQQPKDIQAAPKLLQKALEEGQVQADDSENESDKEETTKTNGNHNGERPPQQVVSSPDGKASDHHHVHHRHQQLDFLLSKASEYSNFIARDLEELQANMTESAIKALHKSEKKKSGSSKKRSKVEGGKLEKANKKLKTAQEKDAVVRAGTNRPIFVQPPNLAPDCQLKDYQLEGVRWMASLFENGVSGILADEMGLGKTIQCVALIAHLLTKGVSGPFLIVAPLATLPNWVREFEKWLPSHPVVRFHGTAQEREALFQGPLNPKNRRNPDFPFIVTSYETAIRESNRLQKLSDWTYVIVDEGHRLKNHRCCLLSSLKKLSASNRLLLSGTPIQNSLDELWSLLNFVNPAIFDELSIFQSWFGFKDIGQKTHESDILIEQRKNQTVTKLHDILRPFLLRRVKADVLSELPPKKEIIVYSGMSKLQQGYAQLIDEGTLRDTLIRQGIEDGRTLSQTNKQMNHRKNINHPFLFGEPIDPITGVHMGSAHPELLVRASGKFALLDRMLERLHRDGHQCLIFSQMTKVLNVMEDYLRWRKWTYCRIDGSTNIDERQRQMDVFNAEKTSGLDGNRNEADDRNFVFLLSTRAGGLGINLTAADTCILFDSDFNPFNDSQAMDRCHRLGQTHPVAVYRLLTVNSVDIDMMERQISKKKLERMTIAGGDFRKAGKRSRGDLSFEHLTKLLESDVKDLGTKGVEDIKIGDEEFEMIIDRKRLFSTGADAIPTEGKMYSVIDANSGDLLGSMDTNTKNTLP